MWKCHVSDQNVLLAVVFQLALWAHQYAYRATILRAPKGNVGLPVRKTVVALINQNLGQSLAMHSDPKILL